MQKAYIFIILKILHGQNCLRKTFQKVGPRQSMTPTYIWIETVTSTFIHGYILCCIDYLNFCNSHSAFSKLELHIQQKAAWIKKNMLESQKTTLQLCFMFNWKASKDKSICLVHLLPGGEQENLATGCSRLNSRRFHIIKVHMTNNTRTLIQTNHVALQIP